MHCGLTIFSAIETISLANGYEGALKGFEKGPVEIYIVKQLTSKTVPAPNYDFGLKVATID